MSSSTSTPENQAAELEKIYCLFAGLMRGADAESGSGGKLLYAGAPDEHGVRLLRAANIAGAASLAASAQMHLLRQSMRDGAIDFVVNSLDEALRILKNEIRKHQPVAVGVQMDPAGMMRQMLERGVLPDLLAPHLSSAPALAAFAAQGARSAEEMPLPAGMQFLTLSIPSAWAHRTAAIDAIMLDFVLPEDHVNCRWLRLAPRYLGSHARRIRSLACSAEAAALIMERVRRAEEAS